MATGKPGIIWWMVPAYVVLAAVLGFLVFRFLFHQPAPAVSQAVGSAPAAANIERPRVLLPETPLPTAPTVAAPQIPPPSPLSPEHKNGRKPHR